MKQAIVVFILAAVVLAAAAFWFFSPKEPLKPENLLQFGIILLIIGFAIFVGYKRLVSIRRGEPAEDELSKKVMQKTAAWSFYISLYLWLAIMYVSDKVDRPAHEIMGAGILGMAIIFALCWFVFNFRGISND